MDHLTVEQCVYLAVGMFILGLIVSFIISANLRGREQRSIAENTMKEEHKQMHEFLYGIDRWHSRADRNSNSVLARLIVIEKKLGIEHEKPHNPF